MYTRKQYMDGEVSHNDYYDQFVTDSLLARVKEFRGIAKTGGYRSVKECVDKHFNDIEVRYWEYLTLYISPAVIRLIAESNASTANVPSISLSDKICVVKAAARQIRGW